MCRSCLFHRRVFLGAVEAAGPSDGLMRRLHGRGHSEPVVLDRAIGFRRAVEDPDHDQRLSICYVGAVEPAPIVLMEHLRPALADVAILAETLQHHAPDFDVRLRRDLRVCEGFWRDNDLLWYADAVPSVDT